MLATVIVFFCKQKAAYELRFSDWSSDVCSSDLAVDLRCRGSAGLRRRCPAHHLVDPEGSADGNHQRADDQHYLSRVHDDFSPPAPTSSSGAFPQVDPID